MHLVHGCGDYVDHAPVGCHLDEAANLYNPFNGSGVASERVLDPMAQPAEFASGIAEGRVNISIIENCRACVLRQNNFYTQRPPCPNTHSEAFTFVRVVKVIPHPTDQGVQWGAYVENWVATRGDPACCYFSDPWWACKTMQKNTRYNNNLTIYNQTWCYEKSALSEFQDTVDLTQNWRKPSQGWNKAFNGDPTHVIKRGITKRNQSKLRTYVMRWIEQADDLYS